MKMSYDNFILDNTFTENGEQREFWKGEFGNEYIERNKSIEEGNQLYKERTGISFEEVFKTMLIDVDKQSKILEIGCNVGIKLTILQKLGYTNLTGIEINDKAFDIAKQNNSKIDFIHTSIEDFDVKNEKYDLVFTSNVLIHFSPKNLEIVIKKMYDLTKTYIFGFEYYADELTEVVYRGHNEKLWKQNFPNVFKRLFPNLEIMKQQKIDWKDEELCDIAYLLKK